MNAGRNIRVGLFVLAGLIFSALVIFLIGDERRLFESAVEFTAKFSDVQGLKASAPVRMGGVDIGHVSEVAYSKVPGDPTIFVKLKIVRSEASRIKTDSVVKVAAKGLLGDKMIEITKGKAAKAVEPGHELLSEETDDFLGKAMGIAGKADAALEGVQRVADGLGNEQLQRDLRNSMASLDKVLKQVSEGEGYPHKLLTDPAEAQRISHLIESLDKTGTELSQTLDEVRQVAARVRTGPGFTHDVIYGDGPKKEVAAFGFAANEVALTLKGIRESESLTHDVLYGGKGSGAKALDNIAAITDDLRVITAGVRQGKGTVGALLVDPSVYEDMKLLLGNVERNDVLRALVRYSIKQDEKRPEVKVAPRQ
jgi:phospholipid/cholesterol/gamma-HCH transport system substrate-binding protein